MRTYWYSRFVFERALALIYLIAFLVSITVHEFGHAFTADKLGDTLPRSQGRVTLSPLAHADLVGTIILPLVGAFSAGVPLRNLSHASFQLPSSTPGPEVLIVTPRWSRRSGRLRAPWLLAGR